MGRKVIDRCNLTALLEPGQEDTAEFLANNGITVIASLPCYRLVILLNLRFVTVISY